MAKDSKPETQTLAERFRAFNAMTIAALFGIQIALIILEAGEAALKRLNKLQLGADDADGAAE